MKKIDGAWFEETMQAKVWHDPYTMAESRLKWRGEVWLRFPDISIPYDAEERYIRVWETTEELAWEKLILEVEAWRDSLRKEWILSRNKQAAQVKHV